MGKMLPRPFFWLFRATTIFLFSLVDHQTSEPMEQAFALWFHSLLQMGPRSPKSVSQMSHFCSMHNAAAICNWLPILGTKNYCIVTTIV